MTEAIVWGVVWLALAFIVAWAIIAALGFGSVALATVTDTLWIAPVGAVLAYLAGAVWFVFAIVQVVLQIISIVNLAA